MRGLREDGSLSPHEESILTPDEWKEFIQAEYENSWAFEEPKYKVMPDWLIIDFIDYLINIQKE
jgi:hypothetical protein